MVVFPDKRVARDVYPADRQVAPDVELGYPARIGDQHGVSQVVCRPSAATYRVSSTRIGGRYIDRNDAIKTGILDLWRVDQPRAQEHSERDLIVHFDIQQVVIRPDSANTVLAILELNLVR
jgi:hypothetical protein